MRQRTSSSAIRLAASLLGGLSVLAVMIGGAPAGAAPGEYFVEIMAEGPCNWTHPAQQGPAIACVWKEGTTKDEHLDEKCFGYYLTKVGGDEAKLWESGRPNPTGYPSDFCDAVD